MPAILSDSIEIACAPEALYAYVTQPWRWNEWHPNSVGATAAAEVLAEGDCFDEVIQVQPLSPLPWRLRRATRYRVRVAEPCTRWEVRGEMRDGWLEIRYRFTPSETGTRFTRTLAYQAHGMTALLMPALKGRMAAMSALALSNLKQRMERPATGRP